jgi:hypothetical protein
MFIIERLISRSAVALSVSIGYARSGAGRGSRACSHSPDDETRSDRDFAARRFLHLFPRILTTRLSAFGWLSKNPFDRCSRRRRILAATAAGA